MSKDPSESEVPMVQEAHQPQMPYVPPAIENNPFDTFNFNITKNINRGDDNDKDDDDDKTSFDDAPKVPGNLESVFVEHPALILSSTDYNHLNTFINESEASTYAGNPYENSLRDVGATPGAYAAKLAQLEESGVLEALGLRAEDGMFLLTLADSGVLRGVNGMIANERVSGEYMVRALAALRKLPPYRGPVHIVSSAPLAEALRSVVEVKGNVLLSSGFLLGVSAGLVPKGRGLTCDIEVRGGDARARSLALFGLRALVFEPETYFVVEAAEQDAAGCLRARLRVQPRGFALEAAAAELTDERPSALPFEPHTPYGPTTFWDEEYETYKAALGRRGLKGCVLEFREWQRSCIEYNNAYYRLRACGSPMTVSLLDWHVDRHAAWRGSAAAKPVLAMPTPVEKYGGKWRESDKYSADGQTATKSENDIATVYAVGDTALNSDTATSWNVKVQSPSKTARGYVVGVARADDAEHGWYLALSDLALRSGAPHSYAGCPCGPRDMAPGDGTSVTVVFEKGALAFTVNGTPLGVVYDGIPLDEPLYPAAGFRFFEDRITLGAEATGFLGKMSSWISWPTAPSDTPRVVYAHESEYCDRLVPGAEFDFTEHKFFNGVKEIKAHMLKTDGKDMWAVFLDEANEAESKDIPSVKARIKSVTRLISKVKANRYSVAQNLPFYIVKVEIIARLR